MADYKSKFTGAEIDDRLNKMLNVTWDELVALRDEGKLIPGQKYRMIDYETTCTWENTQVAGHPFDLVLTALDNKTLDEKCSAIQSERDTDGYFANSNLAAWDVRYCLDNDFTRFDWAKKGGRFLIAEDEWENYAGVLDGTIVIDGTTYYKWVCTNGWAILCTLSENPSAGEEIIVAEIGYEDDYWNCVVLGVEDREDGKGVIYRLIDESKNDVPYDFKNIMFSRPLTEGQYDAENGIDTFCYTFNCIDYDTFEITDKSVKQPLFCNSNTMGLFSKNNVFLTSIEYGCCSNTIGNYCQNNTFGNYCKDNTFGISCADIIIGDKNSSNSFGVYCSNITIGNGRGVDGEGNVFEANCRYISLGDNCAYNIFGADCSSIKFSQDADGTILRGGCWWNTIMNGNSDLIIWNSSKVDSTSKTWIQGVVVSPCTGDVYGNSYSIEVPVGVSYPLKVSKNSSNIIKVYCEADLVD